MNTVELLSQLRDLDVKLQLKDDQLRLNAPKGVLTPELQSELRQHKAEIIALLRRNASASADASLIPPASRSTNLPLSLAQERLWSLSQLKPDSPAYNMYSAFHLSGALDIAALERSLSEIVRRHEILRTTFAHTADGPAQLISAYTIWTLPVTDLQTEPESERETQAKHLVGAEIWQPIELTQDAPLRVRLIQLRPTEYVFVVVMHHISSDGWSFNIFWQELSQLYRAFSLGVQPSLPELPIQYADFAVWHRKWLSESVADQQLNYWQHKLEQATTLDLPVDQPLVSSQTDRSEIAHFNISQEVLGKLKNLCQTESVTLYITLLTAFNILLQRYTGQDDLLICSPVACRDQDELKPLIGYFNNIVVIRTDLSDNPTFRDVIRQVRQVVLEAHENADLPFQQVVEIPQFSRVRLARVLFSLNSLAHPPLDLPKVEVKPFDIYAGTTHFDLSVTMTEMSDQLNGAVEFKAELFEASTISQLIENLQTLLPKIIATPDQPLSELPSFRAETPSHQMAISDVRQEEFVGPRDNLELTIAGVWHNLLKIHTGRISIKDNFYDLGGHSLLAIKMIAQIQKTLDINFPLSLFIQNPTIEHLANILRRENGQNAWSPLVVVKPDGHKRPFFAVHPAGGNPFGYRNIISNLDADRPFYVLQSSALDNKADPSHQIQTLASEYVKELQRIQPIGPYLLGGYCMGGVIALEMAQQLRTKQEAMALLALIDPPILTTSGLRGRATHLLEQLERKLQPLEMKLTRHLQNISQLDQTERQKYLFKRVHQLKHKVTAKLGPQNEEAESRLPKNGSASIQKRLSQEHPQYWDELLAANAKALDHYLPQPYPGSVVVFLARQGAARAQHWSWQQIVSGQLDVEIIPGRHTSILAEESGPIVGKKLDAYLTMISE